MAGLNMRLRYGMDLDGCALAPTFGMEQNGSYVNMSHMDNILAR